MPSKKVPLPRSPLGQEPMENRTYEERFDLLAAAPHSEQHQPLSSPLYEVSASGRNFKIHTPDSPSPRLPPLPPSSGPRMKRQKTDPEAMPLFASHSEQSHRSFGVMEEGRRQSFKDMELEDLDYYWQPRRRCPRKCRCVFATVFLILFSLALLFTCLYLATRPSSPKLEVKVLNITNFKFDQVVNGGAPQVAAGLRFSLAEANPSEEPELIYDQVRIELQYQGSHLGNISISGFKQPRQSNRTLVIELPKTLVAIEDPVDAENLRQDVSRHDVQTDLRGTVAGHYKMWGIRVKKFDLPVDCKLNMEPENDGRPAQLLSSSCYYYPT